MADDANRVVIKGKISSGVLRGKPLIDIFFYQLIHVLGFEPLKGTLNVKIKQPLDISHFATKTIDRVLLDGRRHVDLFIAPVTIAVRKDDEIRTDDCFVVQERVPIDKYMVELIDKESIRQKLSLKDDDEVELIFYEKPQKQKFGLFRRKK